MGGPVQDRERVDAVVGVGVAVQGAVPGIVGVLLLVAGSDLVQVVVSDNTSFQRSMYDGWWISRGTPRAWGGCR